MFFLQEKRHLQNKAVKCFSFESDSLEALNTSTKILFLYG